MTARQRARMAQAAQLEAQRKREDENLKDLEKYFVAAEKLEAVEQKYTADLEKLTATYESDKRAHEDAIRAALSGLRGRGETTAQVAEQTGLSTTQVSAAIKKVETEEVDDAAATKGAATADDETAEADTKTSQAADETAAMVGEQLAEASA